MSKTEDYQAAVVASALCGSMLSQHDLPGLLRDIDQANTLGPILDPTLWRDGHRKMDEDAALLRAALPLWKKAREIIDSAAMQEAAGA